MKKVLLMAGIVGTVLAIGLVLGCCPKPDDPPATVKYTVTFAGGESTAGTVPPAQTVDAGTKIKLPGQGSMTAPTGKTFNGWSIGAAGSTYVVNANVTATAQWQGPGTPTGRQVHVRHMANDPDWRDEVITRVVIHKWSDTAQDNLGVATQTASNLNIQYNGTWAEGIITEANSYIVAVTVGAGNNAYTAYSGKIDVFSLSGSAIVLFYDGLDVVAQ